MAAKKMTVQGYQAEIMRLNRVINYQHDKLYDTWNWIHKALRVLDQHEPSLALEMRSYMSSDRLETWMPTDEETEDVEEAAVA